MNVNRLEAATTTTSVGMPHEIYGAGSADSRSGMENDRHAYETRIQVTLPATIRMGTSRAFTQSADGVITAGSSSTTTILDLKHEKP